MLGLEVRVQFPGIEEIVFDCVAGTRDVRALQSADRVDELELHVEWQARGNAVRVEFVGLQVLGLDKYLVAVALCEPHHLVFDGRAVPGTDALDLAGIHRRAVQRAANDVMGFLRSVRYPATHLLGMIAGAAEIGIHRSRLVSGLALHDAEIHGLAVDPGWRSCLQASNRERHLAQPRGQQVRGWVSSAPSLELLLANMDFAAQERTGGQNHGGGVDLEASGRAATRHAIAAHQQVVDGRLEQRKPGLALDGTPDKSAIQAPIALGTGRPDRRPLA